MLSPAINDKKYHLIKIECLIFINFGHVILFVAETVIDLS